MMGWSPQYYIPSFMEIGPPVLEKKIFEGFLPLVRLMDFKQGLDWTKNTPIVRKAKLGIKLKVIMSSLISRLSSCQKSVASYCKMGR